MKANKERTGNVSAAAGPDGDARVDGRYSVHELVDIGRLKTILEWFSSATGFTTGFVAQPSQQVLIATGWRELCTRFHRACPSSAVHCRASNVSLTAKLSQPGQCHIVPCGNGLIDGATPVLVRGVHIASLFTGQVLFEPPDRRRFRAQARAHGYPVREYLEALDRVPVVSESRFRSVMTFLSEIAAMIAELGHQKLLAEGQADQLRRLAAELTLAEQRERRRLAKVLHDRLQQSLVAASLLAHEARDRCAEPGVEKALRGVERALRECIADSRSLTADLSPVVLYEEGLGAAIRWLARQTREKYGLRVIVRGALPVKVDAGGVCVMLFQSVRELLFNVVKHAGVKRAAVRLAAPGPNLIEIEVADLGAGFAPAPNAAGRASSGLGLFAIRERLELLGGRMEVDGGPGRGTRVRLVAPLPPEPGAPPPARTDGTIRVLIADDHAIVRQGLAELLRREPDLAVAGEAVDGLEAVRLARTLRPDVILMDVRMPRMDGVEATRRILAASPSVRVIGLSMSEERSAGEAMRRAGACGFLSKSKAADALLAAIRGAERPPRGRPGT